MLQMLGAAREILLYLLKFRLKFRCGFTSAGPFSSPLKGTYRKCVIIPGEGGSVGPPGHLVQKLITPHGRGRGSIKGDVMMNEQRELELVVESGSWSR